MDSHACGYAVCIYIYKYVYIYIHTFKYGLILELPWNIQFFIRCQGAIGYGYHRPPQAPEAVKTVDAEQDSQGSSNSGEMATRYNYLMDDEILENHIC